MSLAALLLLAFWGAAVDTGAAAASPLVVRTTSGTFAGIASPVDSRVWTWRGIPYGTVAQRFQSPQTFGTTVNASVIQDASQFGPACFQPSKPVLAPSMSEDCLNLVVWAPNASLAAAPTSSSSTSGSALLPVLVWIHGGGFVSGSNADMLTDATLLVAQRLSIVVVAINYRLGPFGFLSSAALSQQPVAHGASGMYGLQDQRLAFQWIRRNIAAFGGDPSRITIGGQSAGSISVCLHMASPLSARLFQAAILESGGCDVLLETPQSRYAVADVFAGAAGCALGGNDISCLRNLSASQMIAAANAMGGSSLFSPWWISPGLDGYDIPFAGGLSIAERLAAGSFYAVPSLIGYTSSEMSPFVLSNPDWVNVTPATFPVAAAFFAQGNANILAYYAPAPSASSADARLSLISLMSDAVFICPSRRLANYLFDSGESVYLYSWNHAPDNGIFSSLPWMGAFHTAELPFVFGNAINAPASILRSFSAAEAVLGQDVRTYWLNFVETSGDPNAQDPQTVWPMFSRTWQETLQFDVSSAVPGQSQYNVGNGSAVGGGCDLYGQMFLARVPFPRGYMGYNESAVVISVNNVANYNTYEAGSGAGSLSSTQDQAQQALTMASVSLVASLLLFVAAAGMCLWNRLVGMKRVQYGTRRRRGSAADAGAAGGDGGDDGGIAMGGMGRRTSPATATGPEDSVRLRAEADASSPPLLQV